MNLAPPWNMALEAAARAMTHSEPNPRVGCVITTAANVSWVGHTQAVGHAHAEITAIQRALSANADLRHGTAYVTLEPCSHHGRTPPCCDTLIEVGLSKVVIATMDPNPLVSGRGIERLRAAGVAVEVLPPEHEAARASVALNIGFFSRMIRKSPWVRMKMAASLDGTSALPNGVSQWITSDEARADGHRWRARACAVVTGVGTVLEDDPMLDVRLVPATRQPHLVVVDSRLETPPTARLFGAAAHGLSRQIWIYCAQPNAERQAALEAQGAQVRCMPDAKGKVDLAAMLMDLANREVNEVHLEAGHKLNGSFLRAGLVDECLVYLAPRLLGEGPGMSNFGPLSTLSDGLSLEFQAVDAVGQDLRIVARVAGRDEFLRR